MAATINLKDLTPAQRKQLSLKLPRRVGMSAHTVKSHAFKVCNIIADLSPSDRARVLRQAIKLNGV